MDGCSPNISFIPPIVAGISLDGKEWWVEQLFYQVYIHGAYFSSYHWSAASAQASILQLLELQPHHWKPEEQLSQYSDWSRALL
jgi:hypothetical protein